MIAIASDHGGYDLKERVKKYLEENNISFQDFGCDSKASCDYPVFGHAAAKAVAAGTCEKGHCDLHRAVLVSVFQLIK